MKREHYEEWFSGLDDRTVEEIAADIPALDEAAKDRIEALCEEKMRMRDTKMGNEEIVYAGNIQNITRTKWFRSVMTAAACLVLAAGVGGMMMLGGNHHGITPQPPVNSGNEDTSAASAAATEAPTEETVLPIIVTETAVSTMTDTTETVVETAIEGIPEENTPDTEAMRTLFDRNVNCLEYFVTSPRPAKGEPLDGQSIYAVDFPEFVSYAELERYVYDTYADAFAEELLHNFPLNGPVYLEYNGTFCIDTYNILDGLSLDANWSDYQIKHPAVIDENRMTFDVVAENYYVPEEPIALTCTLVKENGSWQFDTMYGYEKVCDVPLQPEALTFSTRTIEEPYPDDADAKKIELAYPQANETSAEADAVNALIQERVQAMLAYCQTAADTLREEALQYGNDDLYQNASCSLHVSDYEITRNDADYLSIVWRGECYLYSAAHPNLFAQGLVIDKKTMTAVSLSDLYDVNAETITEEIIARSPAAFVEKFGGAASDYADFAVATYQESLLTAGENIIDGHMFALTDSSIIVDGFVTHAIGDYLEVEIPFEAIENYKR